MVWSGPHPGRLHRLPPRPLHARAPRTPSSCEGDVFRNVVVGFQNPFASAFYILAMLRARAAPVPRRLEHAADARPEPPALEPRAPHRRRWRWPGSWCSATSRSRWPCSPASSTCRKATMELNANVPSGPIDEKWAKHRFDMKLVNPANKRKYSVIVVGSRPRRRRRRRLAGRARLQRQVLLLPGQPAPRPLDRRPGRHQRRQELPERRRQRLPPLLRHGQGRRLPRARGERLPPRRAVGEHHRPVRGPGRALRPRVRRHCSPTAPSAARRSRARSTRAARPASSSCSAPTRR